MYSIVIPIIFQQQCNPNQFSIEETKVSFCSIHNKLVNGKYPESKENYSTQSNIKVS